MLMLTVHEAAQRLGISISTLYDLVRQRRLGHHRVGVGRGRIMFQEQDLAAYLNATKVEAEALPQEFKFTHGR
jgi:excisionase family DNA binding protein